MAFSTQKDFLYFAFMDECPEEYIDAVQLKRYASNLDQRAWCMKPEQQTQYLNDLVKQRTCQRRTDGYSNLRECVSDYVEVLCDCLCKCSLLKKKPSGSQC